MSSLQRATAELFAALAERGASGPGTLSVGVAEPVLGLAVVARGGACLLLAGDAAEARVLARAGATDFTVDTLSEALRILKNEVRRRRPVSVGLVGDVEVQVEQMTERGVQPEVVSQAWEPLLQRGAVEVSTLLAASCRHAGVPRMRCDPAETAKERQQRDGMLAAHPGSVREWIAAASRLFPRDRERWYWQDHPTSMQE